METRNIVRTVGVCFLVIGVFCYLLALLSDSVLAQYFGEVFSAVGFVVAIVSLFLPKERDEEAAEDERSRGEAVDEGEKEREESSPEEQEENEEESIWENTFKHP